MRDQTWIAVMLYAVGGLRGASDLVRLKQAGIRGFLVASALHDGRLTGADFTAAAEKRRRKRKIKRGQGPFMLLAKAPLCCWLLSLARRDASRHCAGRRHGRVSVRH